MCSDDCDFMTWTVVFMLNLIWAQPVHVDFSYGLWLMSMDNFSSKWLLNALFLATKHGYQFVYPQYCKCLLGFQLCCSYGLYALGPIWDSVHAAWRCAHSSRFNYYMNNYMYGYSFLLFSYMKNCMHRFCFRSTNYSLQPHMLNF